jgi:hypothetical protein
MRLFCHILRIPAMPNAPQASAPALPVLKNFGPALMRLWSHGDSQVPGLRAGMIASAPVVFAKYASRRRSWSAHAMAQGSL